MTFFRVRPLAAALLLAAAIGASGCVHRIPIMQGNFLEQKDIDRVSTGMTRVQVRALLGTPMIADPFHQSRWDYYYYFKNKTMDEPRRQHFVVHFDTDDKVARIERLGEGGPKEATPASEPEESSEQTLSAR